MTCSKKDKKYSFDTLMCFAIFSIRVFDVDVFTDFTSLSFYHKKEIVTMTWLTPKCDPCIMEKEKVNFIGKLAH